jgi:hypothetical protein
MDEMMTVGLCRLSRRGLEQARAAGRRLRVRVTGVLVIAGDVSPALAVDTIVAVELRGPLVAGGAVRRALGGRVTRP